MQEITWCDRVSELGVQRRISAIWWVTMNPSQYDMAALILSLCKVGQLAKLYFLNRPIAQLIQLQYAINSTRSLAPSGLIIKQSALISGCNSLSRAHFEKRKVTHPPLLKIPTFHNSGKFGPIPKVLKKGVKRTSITP